MEKCERYAGRVPISRLPSGDLVRKIRRRHGTRKRLVISYLTIWKIPVDGSNLLCHVLGDGSDRGLKSPWLRAEVPVPQGIVHGYIGQSAAQSLDARGGWSDLLPAIT